MKKKYKKKFIFVLKNDYKVFAAMISSNTLDKHTQINFMKSAYILYIVTIDDLVRLLDLQAITR